MYDRETVNRHLVGMVASSSVASGLSVSNDCSPCYYIPVPVLITSGEDLK